MALPRSYARRLASASQPVIITDKKKVTDGELFGWLAERAWLGALFVASVAGVLLIVSVSSASTRGHHVGSAHAPKTLAAARSGDRHVGHHTPSVKPARPLKPAAHVHRSHRR